jgi:hypothetical protein
MGPIREQTCQPDAKHGAIQPAHVYLALLLSGVEEGIVIAAKACKEHKKPSAAASSDKGVRESLFHSIFG